MTEDSIEPLITRTDDDVPRALTSKSDRFGKRGVVDVWTPFTITDNFIRTINEDGFEEVNLDD